MRTPPVITTQSIEDLTALKRLAPQSNAATKYRVQHGNIFVALVLITQSPDAKIGSILLVGQSDDRLSIDADRNLHQPFPTLTSDNDVVYELCKRNGMHSDEVWVEVVPLV